MLQLKPGVRLSGISPEMAVGVNIIHSVWMKELKDIPCVITSITDGRHSVGSLHHTGNAVDLRIRNIPRGNVWMETFKYKLQDALGKSFDVVLEDTHFHVEFDPK